MTLLPPKTPLLAVLLLAFGSTHAQEAGVSTQATVAVEPAAAIAEAAPAAAVTATLAPLSIPVNVGYAEDMSSYGKVVVVPTAYVKLLVDGSVFAAKQGSGLSALGGGSTNSVKAKASYKVAGIDKALAQGLARQVYDDFVARLRAAGYTVLTYEDIKTRDVVAAAARNTGDADWGMPTEKAVGSRDSYVIAAPSDEMAFKIGFTGVFAEFIKYGKPKFTDAAMVIPVYTINAPLASASTGGGYNRIEASTNVVPGLSLQYASALWMGAPKVRMGGGNAAGVVSKGPVVNISDNAGSLSKQDTTPSAANAISKTLSMLGGGGSISASASDYTFTIDKAAYSAAALHGMTSFNAEVAKALAGQ